MGRGGLRRPKGQVHGVFWRFQKLCVGGLKTLVFLVHILPGGPGHLRVHQPKGF